MNTNLNANSSWTIESIEEAMDAESEQTLGHLTLGFGRAVLPSARDGSPVRVSAAEAAEALERFGGHCWVDESDRLVGWPEDGSDGPDGPDDGPAPAPAWRVLDDAAFEAAAGCRALDARHEGLVALETAARPDVVWLAAFDRGGRWFGSDPHGVLWASWDGQCVVVGSWRHDPPPTWARALVARVTRAIPVEART